MLAGEDKEREKQLHNNQHMNRIESWLSCSPVICVEGLTQQKKSSIAAVKLIDVSTVDSKCSSRGRHFALTPHLLCMSPARRSFLVDDQVISVR